jgi:hypothetical protein
VEQRLNEMGPKGAELLLQFLKDESKNLEKKRRAVIGIVYGGVSLATVIGVALVLTHHPAALAGLAGFSGLAGLSGLIKPSHQYYRIINTLSQLDDVRAVGPLAEALSIPDVNSRVPLFRALLKLLPRLEPRDAEMLNEQQRLALRKILNAWDPETESAIMLVLIKALTTIQDVPSLPTMEALAKRSPRTANRRMVVEAAASSAAILREAKLRMETPQTLLRASTESTAPAQLLRAAHPGPDTQVEQLLRAGNSEQVG